MDSNDFLGWLGAIAGVVGAGCGIPALYLTWKQSKLTDRLEAKENDDARWVAEFESIVAIILRIFPQWVHFAGGGQSNAYGAVFPDPEFRSRIERHLIKLIPVNRAVARPVDVNLLRLPVVRDTITQAKAQVAKYRDENPLQRPQLGL
jgi:hypothetical protein